MKVLILSGSIGKMFCTRTLLKCVDEVIKSKGAETTFWDLAKKPLPVAIPEFHTRHDKHPDKFVRELVKSVNQSDAFILGSPLYHDSYSGVLKNALDNLPNEAFHHKPVGLVSHSSNIRSCVAPCNQLRPVVRSLGGYSVHLQVGTTDADYVQVGSQLSLGSHDVKERIDALVDEVLFMAEAVKAK